MYNAERYIELVEQLLAENLKPITEWNECCSSNSLLLRHDIDFSVEYAHNLALVEKSMGVISTYFFMLSSNLYNVFSQRNQSLIQDIVSMGHRISVHFDPTVYPSLESFLIEKMAFERLFNVEIEIVSIHRPGPFLDHNNVSLEGISQTYHDRYFRDMKYISDSGGRDVFPFVSQYLKDRQNKGLHLLIHPIWWMKKSHSPTETLNSWKRENTEFLTSEIRFNCKTYLD